MTPDAASIVTYRTSLPELRHVLELLDGAETGVVYVVDNSRSEAIKSECDRHRRVVYLPSENNGYGAGHNVALRRSIESGAKYHLVMNSDLDFDPADLKEMVRYMDCHPDVGCMQPRIVNPDGSPQYTARLLPQPLDPFVRRFMPQWFMKKRRHRYELRMLDHDRDFDAPFLQGSFMLLRVDELRRYGLFDERFFLYLEDIDLTRRLHRHCRTVYVPVATVRHEHRAASYRSLTMTAIHCVNMIRYFRKWGWFRDAERRKFNDATLKQHQS